MFGMCLLVKYWWGYINTGGDIYIYRWGYTGGDIIYTGGDIYIYTGGDILYILVGI